MSGTDGVSNAAAARPAASAAGRAAANGAGTRTGGRGQVQGVGAFAQMLADSATSDDALRGVDAVAPATGTRAGSADAASDTATRDDKAAAKPDDATPAVGPNAALIAQLMAMAPAGPTPPASAAAAAGRAAPDSAALATAGSAATKADVAAAFPALGGAPAEATTDGFAFASLLPRGMTAASGIAAPAGIGTASALAARAADSRGLRAGHGGSGIGGTGGFAGAAAGTGTAATDASATSVATALAAGATGATPAAVAATASALPAQTLLAADTALRAGSADSPVPRFDAAIAGAVAGLAAAPAGSDAARPAIAEASLAAPVGSGAWGDELAGQVTRWTLDGIDVAELTLNPKDLGPIRVEIAMTDGKAAIHFAADQPETRAAIDQQMFKLGDSLAQSGIALQSGTSGFDAQGQAFNFMREQPRGDGGGSASPGPNGAGIANAVGADIAAPVAAPRQRSALDLFA